MTDAEVCNFCFWCRNINEYVDVHIFTATKSFIFSFSLDPNCTGNTFRGRAISAEFGLRSFSMTDAEVRVYFCFWCRNRNGYVDVLNRLSFPSL